MFLGDSHAPFQGLSLSVPKVVGTFYVHANSTRNNNQIFRGDQTRCGEIFTGSINHELTRDLFAVANLVFLCFILFYRV